MKKLVMLALMVAPLPALASESVQTVTCSDERPYDCLESVIQAAKDVTEDERVQQVLETAGICARVNQLCQFICLSFVPGANPTTNDVTVPEGGYYEARYEIPGVWNSRRSGISTGIYILAIATGNGNQGTDCEGEQILRI